MTNTVPGLDARPLRHAPPRRRPHTLQRPRVEDAIERSVHANRITVVCAPSGFGKTSAVGGWSAQHPGRVAWLSLGSWDDEPARLGGRVVRALHALAASEPRLGAVAGVDPAEIDKPVVFDALQDALDALDEPVHLVIDDAHRAGDALAEGLLGALIESGSDRLRLIVVGTGGVDARLSRWIAGVPDALIGDDQLAFDVDEIARVLADDDGREAPDAQAVFASTRGWPIAVQFIRFAGRAGRDGDGMGVEAFLRDYVRDNVFRDLPDELRQLILETAVCKELTVPLAEAVTGRADAGALLSRALRMGLFLDAFDGGEATIYRWHPLFARLCRAISDEEDPGRNERSHRAAARHLEQDDAFAAIFHWRLADDPRAIVRVITERWVRIVIGADAAALDRICAALPAPHQNDPAILLVRACVHDVLGAPHAARTFLAQAVAVAGDEPDRRGRAALLFLVGWAGMRHRLTPRKTIDHLRTAAREADALGDDVLAARARRLLAFVLAWAGALRDARGVLEELGEAADDTRPWLASGGGAVTVAAGMIAYWADDHEAAVRDLRRALAGERAASSFRGVAGVMLALVAARSGDDVATARAVLELDALPGGDRQGVSWGAFRAMADAALADAEGRASEALAIARSHRSGDLPLVSVVFAELIRRSGDAPRALEMLRSLGPYREVSYVRCATLLTAALVHAERGAHRLAHEYGEQALEIGTREGLARLFVGAEPAMRDLLRAHLARGTDYEDLAARGARDVSASGPVATLSPRERAVLDLLGTSRSASEIADALQLSVNTLKTHTRSIYRKLGVNSRREAVRAAR
ncbi:LuxR C-terminal-related transcriptional regulator [Microbacterium luteum]|uniref:LuxR C-terminal-related transcriptional regulator n=1 Tax=Microbacterium TaxID=33882 RepID=UPI0018878528|nr:LuxR C-terminal-related transcriptional regulator [Microbacterium luteum]